MAITLVRATALYWTVVVLMRLMGKRQIGELEPSELAVTILISEIAAIPMQDNSVPILNSVLALFVLAAFEVLSSVAELKSLKLRSLIQGDPIIVIREGKIDVKALKSLRITVDDLASALREKDVFDISQVSYAIFETNGKLSVLLKPEFRNPSAADLNLSPADPGMPFVVVRDGKIDDEAVKNAKINRAVVKKLARDNGTHIEDVFIMTVDAGGKAYVVKKEGER